MIGAIVNTIAVAAGSLIGLLLHRFISKKQGDPLMKAMGFVTLYIGITGILDDSAKVMVIIISLIVGTLIGEVLRLDDHLNSFASGIEKRFQNENGTISIAEGFVSASLLFCVGAMTIVGSLQAGLTGDSAMIFTKSLMDFCSSIIFASTMGIGVLLSAVFVLVFQGGITLLAQWIAPFLTTDIITQMTVVGNLLILALGLNLVGATKIKVINMLPAIVLPVILCQFF